MEQNKLRPFFNWVEKNSQLLSTGVIVAIVLVLVVGVVVWSKIGEKETAGEMIKTEGVEILTTDDISDNTAQTATISAITETGKGEVIFFLSAKTDSVVREIQLHNPHKNSWVVAYDGYKPVFRIPIEVFRAKLAALQYDLVQVRTLDSFYPITKEVDVKDGETIIVNLDL